MHGLVITSIDLIQIDYYMREFRQKACTHVCSNLITSSRRNLRLDGCWRRVRWSRGILSWHLYRLSLLLRCFVPQNFQQASQFGPVAVAHILADILPQPRLQSGLSVNNISELFVRELKKRRITGRCDEFGTPNEALPERRVDPYALDDQSVEECRANEVDHGLVRCDCLNDLLRWRSVFW
jgi:hypothetical protein